MISLVLLLSLATQLHAFSMSMSASVSGNDRVVFGTAAISAAEDPYHVLDAAFEKGVRRFDLARTYGLGKSETIFGEWMESRGINRNDIHIITKGGMGDDKYGDPNRPLIDRATLMGEIEASLNALKVEDVDMYMYHRDDNRMPASQFVIWANEIIESGRTAAWGVSNWSFERFQEAHTYAIENGLKPPTANSPQLSLAKPACEVWPTTFTVAGEEHEEQIQWYHENGVELVCWEVLAKGFMAVPDLWCEKTVDPSFFDKEVELGTDEWRMHRIQRAYCNEENYRRRRNALNVAEEHNLSLAQIAALYAMSVSPNISVIMGFLEASQVDDVKDLHHYHFDKNCVIGDDEAIAKSFKLLDLRTLADDAAENVSSVSAENRTEVLAM